MPDLDSFEVFLAVAETGSLSGAARALGLTQQAVSRRLASMEARAGVALAVRTTRGSELTPAGRFVVECASRLLDVARDIDASLGTLRQECRERIAVAASPTIAECLMPHWLLWLQGDQSWTADPIPRVVLTASNSLQVIVSVRDGTADLGFVESPGVPVGLGNCVVGRDELVVVVPPRHQWVRRSRPVSAAELAHTQLVSREAGTGIRDSLTMALKRVLAGEVDEAPPLLELPSMGAVRAAVLAGAGPAVLSRLAVNEDLSAGRLREITISHLDLRRQFRAIWQGGRTPPAGGVRSLLSYIGSRTAVLSG
jgi:DNA-binding transcriptional LysR family regulator